MTGDADSSIGTMVIDVPARQRYEIVRDGAVLGHAAYRRDGRTVVITHTEVDPALARRGLGGQLVRGALDDVRSQGLFVRPACPFVRAWIVQHPEYADLAGQHRSRSTHDGRGRHVHE